MKLRGQSISVERTGHEGSAGEHVEETTLTRRGTGLGIGIGLHGAEE